MPTVVVDRLHADQLRCSRERAKHRDKFVIRCGRRWGKTTYFEREATIVAATGKRVGWFSPSYKLNSPSFRRIYDRLRPIVQSSSKIDQLITTKTSGCVEFWTLQDEDAGRSRFYDLVIIDEASLVGNKLRDIYEQAIAPTLLDRGGVSLMAGTPKGVDPDSYFYLACTEPELGWVEFHAPTRNNPMLDTKLVDSLKSKYPPLVYDQEYLGEFVDWAGQAFFARESLLENGKPVQPGPRCDMVFAVIDTALKDKSEHDATGIVYFAHNKQLPDGSFMGTPLTILDYDLFRVESDLLSSWLPSVYSRCDELAAQCGSRHGWSGPFIEDKASGITLLQHARRHNMAAEPLPSKLTALGKEGRALNVSGYVHRGMVKFSPYVFDKLVEYRGKSRNQLLSQVTGFRIGEKELHEMDLLDCFTYGVAISLGDSEGF